MSNIHNKGPNSSWNNDSIIDIISEEKEFTWQSIQAKWETILPENELKVIEILCKQGVLNQKTLGEELGISAMSISRNISRLETKRLIIRKRLGMSNMIKLKKDNL